MKNLLALSLLLLNCSVGLACESYEECMKPVQGNTQEYFCAESPFGKCYKNFPTELNISKAIAYKLDEISKKLDK